MSKKSKLRIRASRNIKSAAKGNSGPKENPAAIKAPAGARAKAARARAARAKAAGAKAAGAGKEKKGVEISTSRQFVSWLVEVKASLAFTTYQAGKLFFLGVNAEGRMSIFERTLSRCMGMCAAGNSLYVSTLYQLWRFENLLAEGQSANGYDRCYSPQLGYITGDLDIHDIALGGDGKPIFINTLFSCLATVSESHSFVPLWQPPFISRLASEDRCHLNGLAMENGKPRYATSVSQSDVADGWREHRQDGGCVIDIQKNEVVLEGLSMPHSPRLYRGKLWLHDSGTGFFGYADFKTGKFERVAFCPGYLRGLDFIGDFAVVGLSESGKNRTFANLKLDGELESRKATARCGIQVIDLRTGDQVHWVRIRGAVEELYDVLLLPGARRPSAIGFVSDEIRRTISIGDAA